MPTFPRNDDWVLQADEERSLLSQVVEQGPSAVIITDQSGTIEYVNRQFTVLSGYSADEVKGKNPRILKSPRTPPETYLDLYATLKTGCPWFGEFQNLRKDGTSYWVQASISPIADATGRIHRYVGQHIDITVRKSVEEASRAQYRFQVFLTHAAARLVNVRGEVVPQALGEILGDLGALFQADRVFFAFLSGRGQVFNVRNGWDRNGDPLPVTIDLSDAPLWRQRILAGEPLLSTGLPCPVPWSLRPVAALIAVALEGGYGDPGYLVLEAGTPRPAWSSSVQISVTVVANTLSAFMKRVVDEIDLKKARSDAERANQAKSDYLAYMSHEIRTPMNGILGLVELTLTKELGPEARSLVEGIKASGETLLSLVNDILDVSKIEAGKLELETTSFSLKEVVLGALSPLRVLAGKKGLDLTVEWGFSPAGLREGDPTRIRQILTNLIGNAIKFTDYGGITVTIDPGERELETFFSIRDTGPGVAPDRQAKLFRRYSQTEASTTRKFGGTGLGLAICRELVERMGGEIGYRDAKDPSGGIFWFTLLLPGALDPAVVHTPPAEKKEPPQARALRVLVVEDNRINQQVALGLLRRLGVEPVLASHGLEALEILKNGTFDLVLMDIQMPVLDGLAATRAIRRGEGGEGNRSVPIVAMTANAMQGDKEDSLAAGMNDYMTKPISSALLTDLLKKWDTPPEFRTFNPQEMRKRLQLEEKYVRQIILLFLQDLPIQRKKLVEAFSEGRNVDLAQHAHSLRGTSANLVAEGVVESAQELENAISRDAADLLTFHEALLREIDLLCEALTEFLR